MREKICGIYKITNKINLKAYIGQSVDIEKRWRQHKNMSRGCTLLLRAFQKYGIENFLFEIVEICSPEELNEKEKYYIWYYRTYVDYGHGYNLTTGGDGGMCVSEIARKHMSDSLGGEPIYQFNLNGEYLGRFDYIADAERKLNIPHENIIKVLNGDYKSAGGFVFVRESAYQENVEYICNRLKEPKAVKQYSLDGEFIKEYCNQIEASQETGICNATISAVCLGKTNRKTAGGYQWVFSGDEYKVGQIIPHERPVSQFDKSGNLIKVYPSVKDAADSVRTSISNMIRCCKGRRKTLKGFIWEYASREMLE